MSVSVKIIMNIDDYMAIDEVLNAQIEEIARNLNDRPYLYNKLKVAKHLACLWRSV